MSTRSICSAALVAALLGGLWSPAALARGGRFQGAIHAVVDGDTLQVRDRGGRLREVRLAFIDAPEHDQLWGREAHEHLRRLALGAPATIEWREHDQYGRYVGVVWVSSPDMPCVGRADCPRNLDLGHAQIAAGLAWWYRAYAARQDPQAQGQYAFSESEARQRRIGLWHDAAPIPPWIWRHAERR
ncbi:thermonuclease family protein [Niveibacterium umoris]|uniref:Endonuclease YncB(Thermonuclease family) n=1 Tax=Niveibacterium umoris TaxID=1193620 RepID=A0A840BRY4_9RHOO|nr:thermonuclease family protein [Niveibacterium umoris]MBB4014199.1 endonuclease YncB(thermonuclease family) [Niveibacterium umoris]